MNDDHRNIGINEKGEILPLSSDEVDAIAKEIVLEGEILLVISRKDDSLAVKVFGPPSWELLEQLEYVVRTYRKVLEAQ